jgi:urocanate hydratase
MGESISAGMTIVLDGSQNAQERLERVLRTDPGIGVIRRADAGYEAASEAVARAGLRAPMLSRDVS